MRLINPQKDERILDPACGTAGFLISAWKYILGQNQEHKPGDKLTPDERNKLAASIHGYDISPDMVRLSLVNLYLHGFTDPHVDEYDTLANEDKWNEHADVILANPPFMSPKGGIKPHKRFSIQATRSEVLFVDYIHEHLSPNGRAGIIVPEGIIFQSGTAYKALRKLLVQNSLVAVVSLPAGVFQPYSGVKTSILILDKRLAKQTQKVLFVKVSNDGFSLGAQRRPIKQDDLPQAEQALAAFYSDPAAFVGGELAQAVERDRIAESGEWSLSSDRYIQATVIPSKYKQVEIGSVIDTITPPAKLQKESYLPTGRYPIIDQSQNEIAGYTDNEAALISPEKPLVVFGDHTCAVKLVNEPFAQGADGIKIIQTSSNLLPAFLFHFLKTHPLEVDGYKRHFNDLKLKTIPLPPIDVQREIVTEIGGYQKIVEGARQVVENYQPHITVNVEWPRIPIRDLFITKSGTTPKRNNAAYFSGGHIPWVKTLDLTDGPVQETDERVTDLALAETHLELLPKGTVLIAMYGGFNQIGRTGVLEIEAVHNQAMTALLPTPKVDPYYLNAVFISFREHWKTVANSTRKDPNITKNDVINFQLPLPDIETQRAIVAELSSEQALVNANKELIARFEAKIKATIDRVWSEE